MTKKHIFSTNTESRQLVFGRITNHNPASLWRMWIHFQHSQTNMNHSKPSIKLSQEAFMKSEMSSYSLKNYSKKSRRLSSISSLIRISIPMCLHSRKMLLFWKHPTIRWEKRWLRRWTMIPISMHLILNRGSLNATQPNGGNHMG